VGVYGLYPGQHQQDADKDMQTSDNPHPVDLMTPIIFRGCVWSCITPHALVRLSKHYTTKTTTMYRSLHIEENGI